MLIDSRARTFAARLTATVTGYDPRGCGLAVARTLIAAATLSELLFARADDLVVIRAGQPGAATCAGPAALSLWCLGPPSDTALVARQVLSAVVLLVVVSGLFPRWTCIPHWYVTTSLTSGLTLPDGGDRVAIFATGLLIPMLLGDRRVSVWSRSGPPLAPRWRGAAYAATVVLRLQVAIVYAVAAVSKMMYAPWRDGQAMSAVAHNPEAGLAGWAIRAFTSVLDHRGPGTVLGWTVMATELAIAGLVVGPPRVRRWALAPAVALHLSIAVLMGLIPFATTMIGVVLLASRTPTPVPASPPVPPTASAEENPLWQSA